MGFFPIIVLLLITSIISINHVTADPSGSNVIITEVYYDPAGTESQEEWLELYNPTNNPISLEQWTISDNSGTTTIPNFTIPAQGYFVFARDMVGFSNLYGFNPDSDLFTRSLNNAGDQLFLRDDQDTEIDFVAWEGGASDAYPTWDFGNAVEQTIQRSQDINGIPIDTDGPSDWEIATDMGNPGSGYNNPPPPPPPPTKLDIEVFFNDPLSGIPSFDNPSLQEGNLTSGIVDLLNSANTSIDAALYHLSHQPIVDALNDAVSRGITVRIARDNQGDQYDKWDELTGVQITDVTTSYIMHNKFFIVDQSFVFTGSANPTETGYTHNANDGVQIRSVELATQYQAEFDLLFQNIRGKSKCGGTSCNSAIVEGGQIEVYFSPESGDNGYSRFIQLIDEATTSIHLSIFFMTDDGIYTALENARDRGVEIKAVFDHRGWLNSFSEADDVIAWGINAGILEANPGVYHHKFAVFDQQSVWVGSTNWSGAGFNNNDENSLVIHNTNVASKFVARTVQYFDDAVSYDNSETQAPRIITRHYSGFAYENFVSWRAKMDGNIPSGDHVKSYLVWRWNDTSSEWNLLKELNWANEYYSDADIEYDQTYYYCVSATTWSGFETGCSAEYAEMTNGTDGSSLKEVILTPTGHLPLFGGDLTAPIVNIQNPETGDVVSGYLDLNVETSDTSFVDEFNVFIDDTPVGTSNFVQIDTRSLTNGQHTILAEATDMFGNTGSANVVITVDNTGFVTPSPDYENVKIITYNIEQSGINPLYKEVLKEEKADIIVLVESGFMSNQHNKELNRLVVELNNYFGSDELPYQLASTYGQSNQYTGAAILSRYEINSHTLLPVLTLDDGADYEVTHDFLHSNVEIGTENVDIFSVHLKASSGSSNEARREREIEGLMNYIDGLGSLANVIILGDFNSQPDIQVDIDNEGTSADLGYNIYPIFTDSLNPYSSSFHTWTDTYRSLNPSDIGYTYYSSPYESRIDWLMMNQGFNGLYLSSTTGDTSSASLGSDHYTVDVTINASLWTPIDLTPPSQVQGLSANVVGTDQIDLQWIPNAEYDLDYYNIYRDNVLVAVSPINSFSDTGLNPGTSYSYQVSAVDTSANEGSLSTLVEGTTDNLPSPATVVISEVFYDTPGTDSQEEWIELYNFGLGSVDLSGWSISDNAGTWTIPQGVVIDGFSYLVIARSESGFTTLYGFAPDVSGLTTALNNNGDELVLTDSNNQEVDYVAWEDFNPNWDISAPTGSTIKRANPNFDTDTVADWEVVGENGTPGSQNTFITFIVMVFWFFIRILFYFLFS